MKILAELVLSDGRVASIRQMLTSDWLLMLTNELLSLPDKLPTNGDLGLVCQLTTIGVEQLTLKDAKNLPFEDYILLSKTIKAEIERIFKD